MWLQVLLIIIVLVVSSNYDLKRNTPENRHKFMTLVIVVLVIQSGLRHLAVGSDTYAYFLKFEDMISSSWESVLSVKDDFMVIKDPGYLIFQKAFITICPFFRMYLIAIALFFFIPFCRLAERYLTSFKQIFLFFCIYQVLFYGFFSITGIRQTIATVAIIVGLRYIEESKLIKYFIVVILASLIHKSALLLLPFYFVGKFPKCQYLLLASVVSFPFLVALARPFAGTLALISATDRYMSYAESDYQTNGAINFTLFLLLGCVTTFVAKYRNPEKIPNILVNAYAMGMLLAPLTWVDPTLMRVGQYFSMFALITIPLSIDNLGLRPFVRNILFWSIFLLLLATVVRHNVDYAFFWQEMELGDNYIYD